MKSKLLLLVACIGVGITFAGLNFRVALSANPPLVPRVQATGSCATVNAVTSCTADETLSVKQNSTSSYACSTDPYGSPAPSPGPVIYTYNNSSTDVIVQLSSGAANTTYSFITSCGP